MTGKRKRKNILKIPSYPRFGNSIIFKRSGTKLVDIFNIDPSDLQAGPIYHTTPWLFRRGDELNLKYVTSFEK